MSARTLVLLPGLLNDGTVWQGVIDRLAPGIEARVMDLSHAASVPAMAEAVLAATADIQQPFTIAGFSMGGYVTLELLSRNPERFAGVLLQSTAAQPETDGQRKVRVSNIARASGASADFAGVCRDLVAAGLSPAGQADAALVQSLMAMFERMGPEVFVRQSKAVMERADHTATVRALAVNISLRVGIACGELDRITPLSWSRRMAEACPTARFQPIPGAGHLAPCEAPDPIAGLINELMQP